MIIDVNKYKNIQSLRGDLKELKSDELKLLIVGNRVLISVPGLQYPAMVDSAIKRAADTLLQNWETYADALELAAEYSEDGM